ncbi:hypothetical protein D3869_20850 (plasmid) [Azospirillum brasilense]|uniref:VWFA domain-containing protein n=1 Tax=Azospirillum brasilense TaxID=192 RepID=A0A4D8R4Q2_AZOBR|nr:hypothetical protein D3869_20850 [Azospirillum brasilense]
MVTVLAVTLALVTSAASAQHTLPPIDMFVFLDNSKTVFTGAQDGPNQRLSEMLKTAFALPIDGTRTFVSSGDRVSLYTFGRQVLPLAERVDGGNVSALNSAVDRFRDAITPDRVTDFAPLLRFIASMPGLQDRSENRLKILLIASDFVHDPSNQAENNKNTGVCDLLKQYKTNQKTAIAPDMDAVRKSIAVPPDSDQLPVHVGLFVVQPSETDFADTSRIYRDCALETVRLRPVVQSLEKDLNAQTIEYADASKSLDQFAKDFVDGVLRATRPRLAILNGTCRPRGIEGMTCSVTVRNPGRVPTHLRSVALYDRLEGSALATIPVDRSINADAADTIELRVPTNEARALLAASTLYAGLDSDGRGAAVRAKLERTAGGGLGITEAKSERRTAGQPASLTLSLANPQSDPRTVRRLVFYAAASGGSPLGEIEPPQATELARGATHILTVTLTPVLDAALDRGILHVAVQSRDGEGVNDPESARVPVQYGRPAPFQIAGAQARPQDGRVILDIDIVSPGLPARPVRNILFYDGGTPLAPVEAGPPPVDVPAGSRRKLSVTLPDNAVHALNGNRLSVAVDDVASGRASQNRPVTRPASTASSLRIGGLRWPETTESGQLRARIVVVNDNSVLQETLSAVALLGLNGEKVLRPVDPPQPIAPNGSSEVSLALDGGDSRILSILRQPRFGMHAVNDNEIPGPETNDLPTPSYQPLELMSGTFKPNDKGFLELHLDIRNPWLVQNQLKEVRMFRKGERRELAEPLQFPSAMSIPGLSQESVRIPFNKEFMGKHSPHLDQNVVLVEDSGPGTTGRTAGRDYPIIPLPSKPLKTLDGGTWTDRLPLILTVTVQNEAVYNQTLSRFLLVGASGGQPVFHDPPNGIEIRGANRDGAKDVATPLHVGIPIHDEWPESLLVGQDLKVCALTDLDRSQNPTACPGGWATVSLPVPRKFDVQMNKERPFDPQHRDVYIDVTNPGIVPNLLTGYALQSPDGKRDFTQKTLETPKTVRAGKTETLPIRLTEKEAQELAVSQNLRVVLRDKTSLNPSGAPSDPSVTVSSIPVFDFEQVDFKATRVPAREPYTAISADITIRNTTSLKLGRQEFVVDLLDRDGLPLGEEARISIAHDFSTPRSSVTTTVAWGLPGDIAQYAPGAIRIAAKSNEHNVKTYPFSEDDSYNLSLILIPAIAAILGIMVGSVWMLFRRVRRHGSLKSLATHGAGFFELLKSVGELLGSVVLLPVSASIAGLWFLGELDQKAWLSIFAIGAATFAGITYAARLVRRTHVNGIAARGEQAKEMPDIIHSVDTRFAFGSLCLIALLLFVLIPVAASYIPVDPRSVEHHWDFRDTPIQTAASR